MAMRFVATQGEKREAPPLCRWVRREREKAGLTQEAVARRMDLTLNGYRKYERGPHEPRPQRLREIAAALELPENYFFGTGLNER
jgi:transcriptional regulator with XRE-family HTH domain